MFQYLFTFKYVLLQIIYINYETNIIQSIIKHGPEKQHQNS